MKPLRVLVGAEFSGIVRDAFLALGHEAISCDLLPSEKPGPHFQGDLFEAIIKLQGPFDLLIFHWPCTHLCNSGVRWLYGGKGTTIDAARWQLMEADARKFRALMECNIPHICGENPIPHRYAREIVGDYTQTIQPWQHGHGETKRTCLWLKNLPPLRPSKMEMGRVPRVHHASPGPDRWKERSRTYPGVAVAMANQWSQFLSP